MSQTSIKRAPGGLQSNDWMQELEADAMQFTTVASRINDLAARALGDLEIRKDYVGCRIRLLEMQEGLQLLCKLAGVKLNPHVTST